MLRRAGAYVRHNAVAFLALFVALGGTGAYAADAIRSEDIADGEVRNVDLAADAVGTGKVIDGSLIGADIRNSSLTGADLAAASVGTEDIAPLQHLAFGDYHRLELDSKNRLSSRGTMATRGLVLRGSDPEDNVYLHETTRDGRPVLGLGREMPGGYITNTFLVGTGAEHIVGASGEPGFASSDGCMPWRSFTEADRVSFRQAGPRVELGGVATGGTVGCPVFKLPTYFTPCTRQVRATLSAGHIGRVTVETDGTVKADPPSSSTWVALSGISFVSNGAGRC